MSGPCLCGDPYCGRCGSGSRVVFCECGTELIGPCGELREDDLVAVRVQFCDGWYFRYLLEHHTEDLPMESCDHCWDAWVAGETEVLPHVNHDWLDDPAVYRCPDCGALTGRMGPLEEEVAA